ncbi:MAG: YraN family protein [Ferruginibacter sp.]
MAAHNDKGKYGEQLALEYFTRLGYNILHQNWRCRHWEVDIIASKNNMLYFIEVKCRSSQHFGFPEESVSLKKIKHLIDASEEYLFMYPQWQRIQFDVLSISLYKKEEPVFFLIEDVYL